MILALQSDSRGVTGLLVDASKGAARVIDVVTVAREASAEAQADVLKAAMSKLRGSKSDVYVGLGPDEVRVRTLAVPPAPDEELPAIVAMQAAREASADAEQLIVDFLPPSKGNEALVAWAEETTFAWWCDVASRLGGKLVVATPRPLATASLVRDDSESSVILATRAGDDLDVMATNDGMPILLRSARAPADSGATVTRELRRTLMSSPDDGGSTKLYGEFAAIESEADRIDWSAILDKLSTHEKNASTLLDSAAATGLALFAIAGTTPTLNLADPRKPPAIETGRRRQMLLAVATALVLAAGGWMAYERLAAIDRQIAEKEAEIDAAQDDVEAFEPFRERVATLDAWQRSDVTWLDEIERLGRKLRPEPLDSKDFPVEADLRATQVVATAIVGGDQPGGRIDLTALARSSSTAELESRLRDERHAVEPISTAETPADDAYRYKYSALLRSPAAVEADAEGTP
ncbi:MAG: hypothetical protein AAF266_04755 [Planctomycetota bacterium]